MVPDERVSLFICLKKDLGFFIKIKKLQRPYMQQKGHRFYTLRSLISPINEMFTMTSAIMGGAGK